LPYVSNAEKEAAEWISQAQAIEHIRKVDACSESEARRQLHSAASDRPEIVHPHDWAWRHPGGPFVRRRIPSRAELEAHWNNPSKRFNRQLVLSLWPEHVEAALNENNNNKLASGAARAAAVEDRRGRHGNKAVRRHKPEKDAELARRISAVLAAARRRWTNIKTWQFRPMAKELARLNEGQGYGEQTIRQILRGTYPPSRRLKIPGLSG
jgi:hypothetical protein